MPDPLHRGPSDLVAEVRERPADPCVPPHWGFSTAIRTTSAATSRRVIGRPRPRRALPSYVWGDQSPVPAENRVRRDDAGNLHHDAPSALLAAHGESTAVGIDQAKRPRAQVLLADPILLPEIRDQIVLVAGHPASVRENEELYAGGMALRLLGRLDQH